MWVHMSGAGTEACFQSRDLGQTHPRFFCFLLSASAHTIPSTFPSQTIVTDTVCAPPRHGILLTALSIHPPASGCFSKSWCLHLSSVISFELLDCSGCQHRQLKMFGSSHLVFSYQTLAPNTHVRSHIHTQSSLYPMTDGSRCLNA